MHPNLTPEQVNKFVEKIPTAGDDECWEWTGNRMTNNYGRYGQELAHRISYIIENGPISDDLCVLHRCDNPPCVNPNHLFLGTPKDNSDDRDAKGRNKPGYVPGVKNGMAKLTDEIVREIRECRDSGWTLQAIAKEYGISTSNVQYIVKRETWKHVT